MTNAIPGKDLNLLDQQKLLALKQKVLIFMVSKLLPKEKDAQTSYNLFWERISKLTQPQCAVLLALLTLRLVDLCSGNLTRGMQTSPEIDRIGNLIIEGRDLKIQVVGPDAGTELITRISQMNIGELTMFIGQVNGMLHSADLKRKYFNIN